MAVEVSGQNALEVRDLRVSYGAVAAVRGVDLQVSPGEVVVLLGANGAGKTSTVMGIAGLAKSDGLVFIESQDVSRLGAHRRTRRGLATVPEGRRIIAPLTVEENLLLGGYRRGGKRKLQAEIDEIYTRFPNLFERRHVAGGLLSGGEQQMLALARAHMNAPSVILMDEPTMGLSPRLVDEVMSFVAELASAGCAILMAEQNAHAALGIATLGVVIDGGEVTARGTPAELRADPALTRAFLGTEDLGTSISELQKTTKDSE